MNEDWREEEDKEVLRVRELLQGFCMGDNNAVKLIEDLLFCAHVWDDLWDADKERSLEEINLAFSKALGDIPMNPLYAVNAVQLAPMMLLTTLTWGIANEFENSNDMDKKLGSFILRNTLLQFIYLVILIVGNAHGKPKWGIQVGSQFFADFFRGYANKYDDFLKEVEVKHSIKEPILIKSRKKSK